MFGLYNPEIIKAAAGENRDIYVYYTDGSIRRFDVQKVIDDNPEFAPLKDRSFFETHLEVLDHTVQWAYVDSEGQPIVLDIDPYAIYAGSEEIDDTEELVTWY